MAHVEPTGADEDQLHGAELGVLRDLYRHDGGKFTRSADHN
jgi:hypothetical protein